MGGADAEVSDDTTEILLESAYFERDGHRARRRSGSSCAREASARFERGIDPNGVAAHAERAMELFAEVAGAQVAAEARRRVPGADRAARASRAHRAR